jgi:hypothetical protein
MKKIYILFLIIIISFPLVSQEVAKKPFKAAALSFFIPGGGQFYNESYWKFGAVVAIEGSLIGLYTYHFIKENDYYDKYEKTLDTKYYDKYTDYYNKRQNDLWWLGTAIFLSTLDAFVDAHLFDFEEKKQKIHLKFEDKKLILSYRF